jgi:hypothetical protein
MRRALITVAVVVVTMASLSAVACRGSHVKTKTDVAAVEKDIREHLPIGSSRAEVATFLDQRKILHSYIGELKDLPNYENAHTETAIIPDVAEKGIFKSDIQILFKFDDTDTKLVRYSVREIVKGP